jgi:hypothetical protein
MDITTLFKTFKKSAFRLEGLPQYSVPEEDEPYTHFLSSGEFNRNFNSSWTEVISSAKKRGASMKRLRLISQPLTNYETFEVQAYQENIKAGEEIRVMDRDDWPWTGDFWFFDNTWIARMHYDVDGAFVGVDVKEADDDDKADFEYWFDIFESAPELKDIYKLD